MSQTKICTNCKIEKDLDSFHKQKRGSFGRMSLCKECNIHRVTVFVSKTIEDRNRYALQWYHTHKDRNKESKKRSGKKYYDNRKVSDRPRLLLEAAKIGRRKKIFPLH